MAFATFWVYILIAESILITTANTFTLLTFTINKNLRKRSFYFVINLTCADFLVGAVIVPLFAAYSKEYADEVFHNRPAPRLDIAEQYWIHRTHLYSILALVFVSLANVMTLVLISLERMFATVWPLRHRSSDPRAYGVCIVGTWVIGLIAAVILYFKFYLALLILGLWGALMSLTLFASYAAIFIKVKFQHSNHQQSHLQRAVQQERHLATTLLIVTVAFYLSWIPAVIEIILLYVAKELSYNVIFAVYCVLVINSLVNPVIYGHRMRRFRKALRFLVCKCSREQRLVHPSDT